MKLFSFTQVLFIALVFLLSSCIKTDDVSFAELESVDIISPQETGANAIAVGFTESEIQDIGEIHNQYLAGAYSKLKTDVKQTKLEQVREYFTNLNVDISSTGYTSETLFKMSADAHYNLKANGYFLAQKQLEVENLNSYLELIYDEIDGATSLESFEHRMDALYSSISQDETLEESEIEAVKVTIVVTKNSAALWMPESMGGEGLTSTPEIGPEAKWNWGNAILGDAVGAMSVMAEIGVAGAVLGAVPGTNVAIGLAVGISAGIGSAIGGLT